MDSLAFRTANALVGNSPSTEALETVLPAGMRGPRILFHTHTVVAIAGASAEATVDEAPVPTWARIVVPAGGVLALRGLNAGEHRGFRVYLAIRGGFPQIPEYLGSKSTSLGLGGYQVNLHRQLVFTLASIHLQRYHRADRCCQETSLLWANARLVRAKYIRSSCRALRFQATRPNGRFIRCRGRTMVLSS